MSSTDTDPVVVSDAELAGSLAEDAGHLLLAVREELVAASPAELGAAGDRRSQEFLVGALAQQRPDDAVLSEEATDDLTRLDTDRVWIIDPLDGTREFSEVGRSDWAVHVALWERGELSAGAVALPSRHRTLVTPRVSGPNGPIPSKPRVVVSRTRPPAVAEAVCRGLGGVMVPMGSAGAKAMAVVDGVADVYVHAGGQYEWDSAAPVAVAQAAGLHVSRIDGSPLRYNRPDPLLPDLLICRTELAEDVLRLIEAEL